MNCSSDKAIRAEVLMDYCAGTLDPAEKAGLEAHTRECAECRDLVDAQRRLWQSLDTWKPVEVSPDFDSKLYARISQYQAEPWYRRLLPFPTPFSFWKPALSVGALAAVLTIVAVTRMQDSDKTGIPLAPVAQKQTQRINIQEVQQALDDLDLLTPASNTPSPL